MTRPPQSKKEAKKVILGNGIRKVLRVVFQIIDHEVEVNEHPTKQPYLTKSTSSFQKDLTFTLTPLVKIGFYRVQNYWLHFSSIFHQ